MTRKEWVCLNRQGANGAKGFIFEPLRREGREGFLLVFLIGTDDQENNHALRAGRMKSREEIEPRLNTPQYDFPNLPRLNTQRNPGSTGQAG